MQQPPWHSKQRKIAARAARFRRLGTPLTKAEMRAISDGIATDPATKLPTASQPCTQCGMLEPRFKWCTIPYCTNRAKATA